MTKQGYHGPLERIAECVWRIPTRYKIGMRVEGRIFADDRLIEQIRADQAPEQVANVAFLPGIQVASMAMPDIHWGYGFCIGGVCATDPEQGGVVSPGGVGYDINCGVRLVRSNLHRDDVQPRIAQLMDALFRAIPAGVGTGGPYLFDREQLRRLMAEGHELSGIPRAGHAGRRPIHRGPRLPPRGRAGPGQPAGPGAGRRPVRHARLRQPFPRSPGRRRDLRPGRRPDDGAGAGHGLRDDPFRLARAWATRSATTRCASCASAPAKYGIELPDRQLACAPVESPEGQQLPRRDAGGGQLRLGQPSAADVADPRGLRRVLRPLVGVDANEPGLRRGPQHRQDRRARRRRPHEAALRPPQGRHPGLSAGPCRAARPLSRPSASR